MKMFAGCLSVGGLSVVLSCLVVTTLAREPMTTGKVKAGRLNVRVRAGTSFEVVGTLKGGQEVGIFSKQKDWYEVEAPQNAEIWIASKYITKEGVVKGNNVKLRAGPGIVFSSYQTLNKGREVVMTGKSRNGWVRVKVPNGITAWVSADYIKAKDPSVFDKYDKDRKKLTFAIDNEENADVEKVTDSQDGDVEDDETVSEKEEEGAATDEDEDEQVAMVEDANANSGDDDETKTPTVDETDEGDEDPQVADNDVPETTDEVDEHDEDDVVAEKAGKEAEDDDKAVDDDEKVIEKVVASDDADEQEKQSGDTEEVKPVAQADEEEEDDAEDEEAVFTIPELANEDEEAEDVEKLEKEEGKTEVKIVEKQPDSEVEETEAGIFLKFLDDRRNELRRREKALADVAEGNNKAEMAKWIVEPEARGVLLSLKGRSSEFATHILVEIRNKVAYPICYLKSDFIELDDWRNRTVCVYGAERRYPGWKRPVIEVRGIQLNTSYAALDDSSLKGD